MSDEEEPEPWQYWIVNGDCVEIMNTMQADNIDSIVCDPPYEINFIEKGWDNTGVAFDVETWKAAYRVLKPGGHLLAFGATRTYHRMAVAIEDAGFEIRDSIMWIYGSGFPKSQNVSTAIDKQAGATRTEKKAPKAGHENFVGKDNMKSLREGTMSQEGGFGRPWMSDPEAVERAHWDYAPVTDDAAQWEGWGTALKPAHEPIVVARKPLSEKTVAKNVVKHGTGAINIDATRIEGTWTRKDGTINPSAGFATDDYVGGDEQPENVRNPEHPGRWPANIIFDEERAAELDGGSDGASRFFYVAKAATKERNRGLAKGEKNQHPTVKPIALMRYLVRLVTPPDGMVLDPFCGSGTTLMAAVEEGFRCVGIELDEDYVELATKRVESCLA